MSSWRHRLAVIVPQLLIALHDLAMVWLCWNGLLRIRYSFVPDFPGVFPWFSAETLTVLAAQGAVFWAVGLYRGLWRFASIPDLWNILRASTIGAVAIGVCLFLFFERAEGVPRVVLALYPFVLIVLLGAPRMLYRTWKDSRLPARSDGSSTRVLVLGAGRAGEALVRDLRRDPRYRAVGFLDDDVKLHGAKLHGVPVLGPLDRIGEVAREVAADVLVIALPSASSEQMQRVVGLCDESGLPFRTVPRLQDILEGAAPSELKEVAIEDLLGRDPVAPDWVAIRRWLGGRAVLVTGAGGSIGSQLCRQCARLGVSRLTLVDQSELALVAIAGELHQLHPGLVLEHVLGDCGDAVTIRHAMALGRPDAVFHAAAYKQVPLLEGQAREAVRNNTLATATVARACRDAGVGTFVLISTDKAVDPVNVLGASKRLAEMVCQLLAEGSATHFVTVRFGNVLNSAGSVVPLFREQIRAGGPVTVTDPQVTRYFMTIPEACQLILQAAAIDTHEAIYTLDMGEPVPIRLLAEQMIRLAGKRLGRDIRIQYTGLRAGERLHETLFHADESYRRTAYPKILLAVPRAINANALRATLAACEDAVRRYDEPALRRLLREALPDFRPESVATRGVVTAFPQRRKDAPAA